MMDNVNEQNTSTNHYSEMVSGVFECAKDIKSLVPSTLAYEQSVCLGKIIEHSGLNDFSLFFMHYTVCRMRSAHHALRRFATVDCVVSDKHCLC